MLATIGVTRGFGDHDLRAQMSSIRIKPFLSPEPEVIHIYEFLSEYSDLYYLKLRKACRVEWHNCNVIYIAVMSFFPAA